MKATVRASRETLMMPGCIGTQKFFNFLSPATTQYWRLISLRQPQTIRSILNPNPNKLDRIDSLVQLMGCDNAFSKIASDRVKVAFRQCAGDRDAKIKRI